MNSGLRKIVLFGLLGLCALSFSGCMTAYRKSVGADATERNYDRRFYTDMNTAWQSCLDAMKANPLDISNRESGYIQTKWVDNTEQRNLDDAFGDADSTLKAQYRFKVNVSNSFAYNGEPVVKVSVEKDQLVQRDVLEGWRFVETDSIDENTLLYRIGRLIYIKMKIAQLEEEKVDQESKKLDLSK